MEFKITGLKTFYNKFFLFDQSSEDKEIFKNLSSGIILSNAILILFDIVYVLNLNIKPLIYSLPVVFALNVLSFFINKKSHFKIALYIIIILNILIFPINTLLFSIHEEFYFICVLGSIILAIHLPRFNEFFITSLIGIIIFFIERSYWNRIIDIKAVQTIHPALFYVKTCLMFMVYSYWLYLFKRNHYIHSNLITDKDLSLLKYKTALDQSDAAILITDKLGNIEYANPQIEKTTGYSISEILGKDPSVFHSELIEKDSIAKLQEQLKNGKAWKGTFSNRKKNNDEYTTQAIISPVKNFLGEIINYVTIMEDSTEHLKMISELRESTEKYRQLSEQNDDIIYKIDLRTLTFNYINPASEKLLGFLPKEIIGSPLKNYFTEESYKCLINDMETYLKKYSIKGEGKFRNRYQMLYKNQHAIDVEVTANFVVDEKGNPYEAHGIARDISEQLKQEQDLNQTNKNLKYSLNQTEQRFINIFRIIKDAIVILTPDLNIIQANDSFYKITETMNAENIHNIIEIITYKNIDIVHKSIEQLHIGKSFCQFETEIRTAKDNMMPVEIHLSLISEYNNSLILCVIRDISIRKNYEQKLIGSSIRIENRERQKLAIDLHDNLGPLLSSLKMCLSLLFRKPEIQKYNNDIADINKIIKESIAVVREISDNLSPQTLIKNGLITALNNFFETKQNLIHINFMHNIDSFRFDEIKENILYNVLKELFNNTIKYSQSKDIRLNISKISDLIKVEYQDYGIGFSFDEKLTPANENLSIFSIINRLKILEGEYNIVTAPGEGFLLNLIFPI